MFLGYFFFRSNAVFVAVGPSSSCSIRLFCWCNFIVSLALVKCFVLFWIVPWKIIYCDCCFHLYYFIHNLSTWYFQSDLFLTHSSCRFCLRLFPFHLILLQCLAVSRLCLCGGERERESGCCWFQFNCIRSNWCYGTHLSPSLLAFLPERCHFLFCFCHCAFAPVASNLKWNAKQNSTHTRINIWMSYKFEMKSFAAFDFRLMQI